MKAIVLGSTGLVGGELTKLLIADDSIKKVVLLNRRHLGTNSPKVEEKIIDFSNIPALANDIEADLMFCCLGTTIKKAKTKAAFRKIDHDIPLEFAQMFSERPHIAFAVISALGANPKSPFFYNQVKGDLERDLKALPLNNLVIVRPSLLIGERKEKRLAEGIGQKLAPLVSKILPKQSRPVRAKVVAETMLDLALGRDTRSPVQHEVLP